MRRTVVALLVVLLLLPTAPASAHPLGNFSVNRYSGLDVSLESVRLRYVLDLAEVPTLQELQAAGLEPNGVDEPARRRVLEAKARDLAAGARLTVGGRPVEWTVGEASLELVPGQADLPTMRVGLTLTAPLAPTNGTRLDYRDLNYRGRAGWQEVVLRAAEGVALADSDAPTASLTDELRSYPADPAALLNLTTATATLRLTAAPTLPRSHALTLPPAGAPRLAIDPAADHLAAFLRGGGSPSNPLSLLLALAVAAAFGALHALGPGHGKTVVGAYLVGSRGTARHAALLGLTVTLTHTAGVYALGLVTLLAAQYVLPEQLFPVLGVVSGLLVVAIGLSLVRARLAGLLGSRAAHAHGHSDGPGHHHLHGPGRGHSHGQGRDHAHEHADDHGHDHAAPGQAHRHGGSSHSHLPPGGDGERVTLKSLLALGVSGGLLPCPSALVVLLAAVSFHNVALGMALVAAFSLGLAAVLTGIGLALVYGGRLLHRSPLAGRLGGSPLARAVPALSALAITAAGLAITLQAAQTLTR
jgi:ABC-type nickel/cobalt efflux system permease component RcnA